MILMDAWTKGTAIWVGIDPNKANGVAMGGHGPPTQTSGPPVESPFEIFNPSKISICICIYSIKMREMVCFELHQ